jgi:hypothetical protein
MYAAQILAWTTLELDPREVHELGRQGPGPDPGGAAALGRSPGPPGRGRGRGRDRGRRRLPVRLARGAEGHGRGSGREELGTGALVVRPPAELQLRGQARRGLPRGRHALRLLQPAHRGRVAPRRLLRQRVRPVAQARHHLASTTYHEANPGHHFQIALEQEMEGRPRFVGSAGSWRAARSRRGWGLYSERLADEMGMYDDESERLGMLDLQGMRAGRLVTDTGIHALGWTRERAIQTLEEAGVPTVEATIEIDRYITMPGQALSYKIGQFEDREAARRDRRTRGRGVLAAGVPRPAAGPGVAAARGAPARSSSADASGSGASRSSAPVRVLPVRVLRASEDPSPPAATPPPSPTISPRPYDRRSSEDGPGDPLKARELQPIPTVSKGASPHAKRVEGPCRQRRRARRDRRDDLRLRRSPTKRPTGTRDGSRSCSPTRTT